MEHSHASRSNSTSTQLPGPTRRRILSDSDDERDGDDASPCPLHCLSPQPATHKRHRILSNSEDESDSSDLNSESESDENSDSLGNSSVRNTPTRARQCTSSWVCTAAQQSRWSDGQGFVPASYCFEGTNSGITSACDNSSAEILILTIFSCISMIVLWKHLSPILMATFCIRVAIVATLIQQEN